MKDLNFGDTFIGYSREILDQDDEAAEFLIFHTSSSKRDLLINFDLPGNLTNGLSKLPIIFYRRHASWAYDVDGRRRQFNPHSPLERRRVRNSTQLYLWLGGKIEAYNNNLSPGSYSGTIILTVEYL